ncbi:helix-turn-helix transcriptional regulator [Endozoicomonas lisbonensis]|uniref:helix-turn-helix transcriptional regulator n=1 Tax=Endozoicomonas lisbonensis TaxID=3120522 RepID=UPI0033984FD6
MAICLPVPVREHWFSVILILSKTTKVPTETELIWLQSVMYRFNHYYYDINPWRRGLIAKRPMQILELIHQGYEDKQVAQILKMSHHTVRDRLNDLRASFEGCQELLEKGQTMACNQLEVIGLADDYGIVRPRLGNRNDPDIEVYTKISKSLR